MLDFIRGGTMKKINIEEDGSIFLASIFTIISIIAFCIVVWNCPMAVDNNTITLFIIMCMSIWGTYHLITTRKNGIRTLTFNKDEIIFLGYNDNKKEITRIKLDAISSFNLSIYHRYDYQEISKHNKDDLKITIDVTTTNNHFNFGSNYVSPFFIKNFFKIAKLIPNFSYTIDSNSNQLKSCIENYLTTNKWFSIKEIITRALKDPNVPDINKTLIRFGLVVIFFYGFIILLMLGSIVHDIAIPFIK